MGEGGQATLEWVGLLLLISLLLLGLLTLGVRVPGLDLARLLGSRILCAASLADGCGDEPVLIAAYGDEVGRLVREHMPTLVFEQGSRAVPVDFRRCRSTVCGDGAEEGLVHRTDRRLPVTAFVHVVDCRPEAAERSEAEGLDCSGERTGYLYVSYWTYYADSATLRDLPIVGEKGFHEDDWESVQLRIGSNGEVEQRASSHNGYNHDSGAANWGADADIGPLRDLAEVLGARPHNGWGPETGYLYISGGSHAGAASDDRDLLRFTPGRRVHLIPLEPIAAEPGAVFAISPPWRKRVWSDPEAEGTS